jgi:ribosomal protein L29
VSLAGTAEAVVMPDMSPTELAKRLHAAEAALARVRSSRAVRWTHAARRAQRRVAGVPVELLSATGQVVRGRRPGRRDT